MSSKSFWGALAASIVLIFAVFEATAWDSIAGLVLAVALLAGGVFFMLCGRSAQLMSMGRGLAVGSGGSLVAFAGLYAWIALYMNGAI
jgi:hypothetical protein